MRAVLTDETRARRATAAQPGLNRPVGRLTQDGTANMAKRVLVVEDDEPIRGLLVDLLQTEGYIVREAATGCAALEEFERELPDAMVLDLMLPDMDGRAIAEQCHRRARANMAPILLMSAAPHVWRTAEQLRRFGVRGFMSKPFDLDIFLAAVARMTAPALAAAS